VSYKSAELELVRYNVLAISHATDRFVYNFSEYSGIEGTENWPQLWFEVMSLVRDHEGFNCLWAARGVDISFSFFDDPQPRVRKGNIVYATPEPQIAFYEKPHSVPPAVRTYVGKTILEIAEEMQEVYHLRLEKNPLRILFPNEEYAQSIQRFRVPLLSD